MFSFAQWAREVGSLLFQETTKNVAASIMELTAQFQSLQFQQAWVCSEWLQQALISKGLSIYLYYTAFQILRVFQGW